LTLVFGHSLYYWHRNVLIQHSETLKREYRILLLDYPEGFVELNTEDAKQLGLQDGQRIRLRSAAGSAATVARVTSEVRSGMVFVPYFVRQVQQKLRRSAGNGVRSVAVCVEKEVA
jgi:formate dehydrogenase major subunit